MADKKPSQCTSQELRGALKRARERYSEDEMKRMWPPGIVAEVEAELRRRDQIQY